METLTDKRQREQLLDSDKEELPEKEIVIACCYCKRRKAVGVWENVKHGKDYPLCAECLKLVKAETEPNSYRNKKNRNKPCLCGSGKKFKICCADK